MTLARQVAFKAKADGSLIEVNGQPVGSSLIGQDGEGPEWFDGCPSAIDDDASTSSGSNLGPRSQDLADEIAKRNVKSRSRGAVRPDVQPADIPVDLVTASGSGLDPHISVAAALFQAPRIAAERGLSLEQVQSLIREHTQGRPSACSACRG